MAWSVPRTWLVGEVVTASEMNQYVRDEFAYLHGDAGQINLASGVSISGYLNTSSFIAIPNNVGFQGQDSTGTNRNLATVDSADRVIVGDANLDALGKAFVINHKFVRVGGVSGRTVQQRGDGANGHEESVSSNLGAVAAGTGATYAWTFADPFAATPDCFCSAEADTDLITTRTFTPSTTGVNLRAWNGTASATSHITVRGFATGTD